MLERAPSVPHRGHQSQPRAAAAGGLRVCGSEVRAQALLARPAHAQRQLLRRHAHHEPGAAARAGHAQNPPRKSALCGAPLPCLARVVGARDAINALYVDPCCTSEVHAAVHPRESVSFMDAALSGIMSMVCVRFAAGPVWGAVNHRVCPFGWRCP